ncbi:J-domain-containing protein [Niallia sp. 01092]|uniref:J-domain-containing protein n=1 Tax=unclassified Niallia TaxID=2837522 RepID=UPI003FD67B03
MDFSSLISEEKIKKAYKNGEFNNLPGFGKTLPKDDLAAVPEELRMAYRVLKNAGFSPEENQLKQELLTIEDLLKTCCDKEKEELQKKYNEKLLRFNKMMREKRGTSHSASFKKFQQKIESKLWEK